MKEREGANITKLKTRKYFGQLHLWLIEWIWASFEIEKVERVSEKVERDTDNKRVEKRDRKRKKLHVRLKERENKNNINRECKKTENARNPRKPRKCFGQLHLWLIEWIWASFEIEEVEWVSEKDKSKRKLAFSVSLKRVKERMREFKVRKK